MGCDLQRTITRALEWPIEVTWLIRANSPFCRGGCFINWLILANSPFYLERRLHGHCWSKQLEIKWRLESHGVVELGSDRQKKRFCCITKTDPNLNNKWFSYYLNNKWPRIYTKRQDKIKKIYNQIFYNLICSYQQNFYSNKFLKFIIRLHSTKRNCHLQKKVGWSSIHSIQQKTRETRQISKEW